MVFARSPRTRRARPHTLVSVPNSQAVCCVQGLEPRVLMSVYTVTTTADAGPGSLREAIVSANAAGGTTTDEIRFDIPGPGVHTIAPASPLPVITGPTVVDGRSQPGYAGAPLIELSGAAAGAATDGLVFMSTTGPAAVAGLVVNRFGRHGVVLAGRSQNSIVASYVGTDATGTAAAGNGGAGVVLSGGGNVGGPRSTPPGNFGNVISGNGGPGVILNPVNVSGDRVMGNYIGTDVTGAYAIANGREGVLVQSGMTTLVTENVISGNGSSGVRTTGGAGGVSIHQNFIGTDAAGQRAVPNGTNPLLTYHDGVTVEGVGPVVIGSTPRGDLPGGRNVISGNVGAGISIRGGASSNISHSPAIYGNFVGTDSTGNVAVGNGGGGIRLIGTTGATRVKGNVISGNGGDGLYVESLNQPTALLNVNGNYIGTNVTGTAPVGNAGDGVALVGPVRVALGGAGPTLLRLPAAIGPITVNNSTGGNLISANGGAGVSIQATEPTGSTSLMTDVSVIGNVIGSDVLGNADLGNAGDGVRAASLGAALVRVLGNLVSGNNQNGIYLEGAIGQNLGNNKIIAGNYIGTNGAGDAALPNEGEGVVLRRSESVAVGGQGSFVRLPFVNPAGTGRNVISGNRGHGVLIDGEVPNASLHRGHRILNNFIGTDAGGTIGLGNGGSGIHVAAGSHRIGEASSPNVISANRGNGITLAGTTAVFPGPAGAPVRENQIIGNRIGVGFATSPGITPNLGNRGHGIAVINSPNNRIGTNRSPVGSLDGNTIAFNGGNGILVEADPAPPQQLGGSYGDGNLISGNSIFSNARLGIDLSAGFEGVTPNDARDPDAGPNRLQNYPVITRATRKGTSVVVQFTLNSERGRAYRVEFFGNPDVDPTGFGEGRTFLGAATVATDGDGNGSGTATLPLPSVGPAIRFITATATGPTATGSTGNTSEFSRAVLIGTTASSDGRVSALELALARRALTLGPASTLVSAVEADDVLT